MKRTLVTMLLAVAALLGTQSAAQAGSFGFGIGIGIGFGGYCTSGHCPPPAYGPGYGGFGGPAFMIPSMDHGYAPVMPWGGPMYGGYHE